VQFLDLEVLSDGESHCVKPYFKPTNTFSYTMGHSYHPRFVSRAVVRGKNVRILSNYGKESDYIQTMNMSKDEFKQRGICLESTIPYSERELHLESHSTAKGDKSGHIPYISYYDQYQQCT